MADTAIDRILSDLPKIQATADSAMQQNPLLSIVLQQAMALAKISEWTINAQQGVAAEQQTAKPAETAPVPDTIPSVAEVLGVPEDAVELVPAGTSETRRNGS